MAVALLRSTTITDLPDEILSNIIAYVSGTRSRNAAALVCRRWRLLERATRTSLVLRGNARDLADVPNCFQSVTDLDLSLLSPWGHSLAATPEASFVALLLRRAFPAVTSLTVYARCPSTLGLLAPLWPQLTNVKLVRWHQRPPQIPTGADFAPLFEYCQSILSLDLSAFYCWTDDIPPALQSHASVAGKLTKLDLLNPSFAEGFKSDEIKSICSSCPNLRQLSLACVFDHRYIGFVDDETLLSIPANCPKLTVLHLIDKSALVSTRGDPAADGLTEEDASIGTASLIDFFSGLPLLEELTLDVCRNVRESRFALEQLNSKCPKLKSLKLGQFHGVCTANEATLVSKLDGIALCQGLESLSIKNSADLTDLGLIAIAKGCAKLSKLEIEGCGNITFRGLRILTCLLRRTLTEVSISCCNNLGAASSLKALEPIHDRLQRLHIDCIWDSVEQFEAEEGIEYNFDFNEDRKSGFLDEELGKVKKKCKYDLNLAYTEAESNGNGNGNGNDNTYTPGTWPKLRYLSLWIGVGEVLTPLPTVGLEDCPNLEEIKIKIEGDCRMWSKPSVPAFGLECLILYPKLTKMHFDCGDTIGYAHTAPTGQMDLSQWERFYLFGIQSLSLSELDYWPPQDRDVNQRSLSLPAAGLLAQCYSMRKLFIHGTAHEHFMNFLLNIPNLRDVQLREDYYPAPESDMSTEMRVGSCCRFEDKLNGRPILD